MIPNQFHFVFGMRKQTEPFHLAYYLCLESCRRIYQPKVIYLYYHYEPYGPYWDRIKEHLTMERVELPAVVTNMEYPDRGLDQWRYAHYSDFVRLEKLVERGGVYADIDTIFFRRMPEELFQAPFVLGRERDTWDEKTGRGVPSLCNALMMAEPGAEFGKLWLARMAKEFDGTWSNHSTLLPCRLAEAHPELIRVEPVGSFFHFASTFAGLDALFESKVPVPEKAYSAHLWEHMWWKREKQDVTSFHAGLLTWQYFASGKTTYAEAGRPYLPPAPAGEPGRVNVAMDDAREWARVWGQRARTLLGLAVYPWLTDRLPHAAERLRLARANRAFWQASSRFRLRTAMERTVLRTVTEWDEYRIFGEPLQPGDVVIDVGGHVGSFSYACHWLGSRKILTFEAHPGNAAVLRENLRGLNGITIAECAIFRSGGAAVEELLHSGPLFSNTGGGSVMFGERMGEFHGVDNTALEAGQARCKALALDEVLANLDRVKIMKLDCEGSEFPILLTSRMLGKVERIVGEYHCVEEEAMGLLVEEARVAGHSSYTVETLRARLEGLGFSFESKGDRAQGLFWARRAH